MIYDQLNHNICTSEGCRRMNVLERESCPGKKVGRFEVSVVGLSKDEERMLVEKKAKEMFGHASPYSYHKENDIAIVTTENFY